MGSIAGLALIRPALWLCSLESSEAPIFTLGPNLPDAQQVHAPPLRSVLERYLQRCVIKSGVLVGSQ